MKTVHNAPVAQFAGTGHSLPARKVFTEEFDRKLGFEEGWLRDKTGIESRYVCEAETQVDLAVSASKKALEEAQIPASEVDLVLGACGIPYQTLPATAPLVMRKLGIQDGACAAYDVNSTCLSFLTAIDFATAKIATGHCRNILVFSSEVASRALPWSDAPEVAALFGDGAAAAVISKARPGAGGILGATMKTYPTGFDACQIGAGGTRFDFQKERQAFEDNAVFSMQGRKLYQMTSRYFPGFVAGFLDRIGWRLADVDVVVPHQASPQALAHMVKLTGLGGDRVVDLGSGFGNQIAASIPTALDVARKTGKIAPGNRVLMLGTSAGISFGAMAFEA